MLSRVSSRHELDESISYDFKGRDSPAMSSQAANSDSGRRRLVPLLPVPSTVVTPPKSPSSVDTLPRNKRQPVTAACEACRKRKSKAREPQVMEFAIYRVLTKVLVVHSRPPQMHGLRSTCDRLPLYHHSDRNALSGAQTEVR